MPAGVVSIAARRRGEFVVLEACLPGRAKIAAGILLLDPESGKGWFRLRSRFDDFGEEAEIWQALAGDIEMKMREGAEPFLRSLEDSLSSAIRITDRQEVAVDSFTRVLDRLFDEHVEPVRVEPYRTHVPVYTLRAAAGYLGEEVQAEAEEWTPLPEWRRPSERLFAARVEGQSMEPLIPDGSLNLFSYDVQGSRGGKVVLIERFDAAGSAQRYSVKRYTSSKKFRGEEWEHGDVTFVPVNRDYEPWSPQPGEFRIVAEWLGVIE